MPDFFANQSLNLPASTEASLIGAWANLASSLVAEAIAAIGFDWLLIDAEHGPNDVPSVLAQLQAVAAYPVVPVVRIPNHDASLIKRYLDIGAHNLLVPMVDSAAQATAIVEASRYPGAGIRGVGAGLARASRWSLQGDYLQTANASVRLIAQIETESGLENLDAIMAVAGVDAVFLDPLILLPRRTSWANRQIPPCMRQCCKASVEPLRGTCPPGYSAGMRNS